MKRYDVRMPAISTVVAAKEAEFVERGTALLRDVIVDAIAKRNVAIVGLSGGSTPKAIYEALGKEKGIDWTKVWIFLVDDRYAPRDNPNSNQFLLDATLLKEAPIPNSHLVVPDTSLPLPECITLYERHLADLLKKGQPDVVTLGMGDDGHIASLFPPVSDDAFGKKLVIATTTEKFSVRQRISTTAAVLTQAKLSLFMLKGGDKKTVWDDMMKSSEGAKRWPAKIVLDATPVTILAQW
jgi:6-phosphogluconolactonase